MRGTIRPARCRDNHNRWQIIIDKPKVGGKRHQHVERFDGEYKDAEVRLAQLIVDMGTNRYIAPSRKTLAQLFDEWLGDTVHLSAGTLAGYRRIAELYIKPALGHIQVQRLSVADVNAFLARMVRQGGVRKGKLASGTVAKVIAVLSSSLDYAHTCGYTHENVCKRVKIDKVLKIALPTTPHKIRVLDEEETVRLIATARGSDLYLPILIAATTGMRRGEILALTWDDVDFEEGIIHVTHSLAEVEGSVIVKGPKSYAGVRDITIPQLLMEELLRHRGEGRVCYDVKPSTFSAQFSRWMKRCGLEKRVTFHGLRHGHFSQLIRRGIDPKQVQDRAGHASAKTTMDLYVHVVEDDMARKVDEMLAR